MIIYFIININISIICENIVILIHIMKNIQKLKKYNKFYFV